MINGRVTSHHVLLSIQYRIPGQGHIEMECVVDTGFTGYLALPKEAIVALKLPNAYNMSVNLADNSTIEVEVYVASVIWNGEPREVEVLATGIRPLIGTMLLEGCELNIQFAEGGLVTLSELYR